MKRNNKGFTLVELLIMMVIIGIILFLCSGCAYDDDVDVVTHNLSKEADNFRVRRRITFINLRSDNYLFSITGNCSIQEDHEDKQLEVICKIGDNKYQKHFLKETTEVTYIVEQLEWKEVSKYNYEIIFKPQSIIDIDIKTQ